MLEVAVSGAGMQMTGPHTAGDLSRTNVIGVLSCAELYSRYGTSIPCCL
jgi:hypothetical protein